jgi:hypothetical protein
MSRWSSNTRHLRNASNKEASDQNNQTETKAICRKQRLCRKKRKPKRETPALMPTDKRRDCAHIARTGCSERKHLENRKSYLAIKCEGRLPTPKKNFKTR